MFSCAHDCCGKIEKSVWPLNFDSVLDVMSWKVYIAWFDLGFYVVVWLFVLYYYSVQSRVAAC